MTRWSTHWGQITQIGEAVTVELVMGLACVCGRLMWQSSQTSFKLWSQAQNNQIQKKSVSLHKVKGSSTVSSKVLKTIYWLALALTSSSKCFADWIKKTYFLFCLQNECHLEVIVPTKWHRIFTLDLLIEVSRILEGVHACHMACSLKFQTNDSPTGTFRLKRKKKTAKENIRRKIKALASR